MFGVGSLFAVQVDHDLLIGGFPTWLGCTKMERFAHLVGQDALKADINTAIKTIRANGSYKTLNDKYFAKYNIDVYVE